MTSSSRTLSRIALGTLALALTGLTACGEKPSDPPAVQKDEQTAAAEANAPVDTAASESASASSTSSQAEADAAHGHAH